MNDTDATRSGPHRLRTSDPEREQVAEILRAAMAEGRLTLDEGEERLAAVYASRFRDELAPLTADLPDGGRQALAETPQARSAESRALRRHAGVVAVIALLLTGVWALSGAQFFWPIIPLGFLVMGVVRHARYGRYAHQHHYRHHGNRHRYDLAPWNAPGHR